ncbi:GGDEF domain-containing protein [Pseudoalteromonas sp. 0303]|nr:GGDEF domain-containing protein [Pseudoalteromonas shioyasakiensis]MDI4654702.1 GGDEF domain-containing protein [Pseudoalteromonas shioyasakiensis]NUJ41124.1 GGDEF domain-containing protein [Pseudoalteromonas sp. 0303]
MLKPFYKVRSRRGDEVLIAVANLLGSQTRENDVLVRWGGEEFILVVENKQKDNVISIVDRIIKTISNQAVNTTLGDLDITISAGATSVKNGNLNSLTWPKILNCIDEALYTAKHNGRNQAVVI